MATQLVKLKKDVGRFKAGEKIKATADELRGLKLQPGRDYLPLGTYPHPVASDLAQTAAPASPKTPKPKPQTP